MQLPQINSGNSPNIRRSARQSSTTVVNLDNVRTGIRLSPAAKKGVISALKACLQTLQGNRIVLDTNSDDSKHDFKVGKDGGWNKTSMWAGSTAAESDRDYIGQGTKGSGNIDRPKKDSQTALVEKFKGLKEDAVEQDTSKSINNVHSGHKNLHHIYWI